MKMRGCKCLIIKVPLIQFLLKFGLEYKESFT